VRAQVLARRLELRAPDPVELSIGRLRRLLAGDAFCENFGNGSGEDVARRANGLGRAAAPPTRR